MEKNWNILDISLSSSGVYKWGNILGGFAPILYKQEDIGDALVVKHGLMRKTIIPLNPQRKIDKLEIWQLMSSITIWYIWKTLKVFQNYD